MRYVAMMLVAAGVVVGCSKADNSAADSQNAAVTPAGAAAAPAGIKLADVAGNWNVKGTNEKGDSTLVTYTMTATADTTGWTINLPNRPPVPGHILAVGGDSTGEYRTLRRFSILTSPDGTNWTTQLATSGYSYYAFELHGLAFGGGLFVAVGRPGTILTSTDGMTWVTNVWGGAYWKGVAYGNGTFVVIGETTSALTSTDGTNWVVRDLPIPLGYELDDAGHCKYCGTAIAGRFGHYGTPFGARRIPVHLGAREGK